jgi:hypothetical protein
LTPTTQDFSNALYMSSLHDFLNHPIETLERALHIRKQIAALEKALKEVMGHTPPSLAGMQASAPERRSRRTMSAEARAKISEAQKLRWAKSKGFESAPSAVPAPAPVVKAKKRGGMSAEGKARIAAAQKARWAKIKAQKAAPAAAPVKAKRKISAAHRAKPAASAKARWAREKKGVSDKGRKQITNAGQPKFKIF